MIQVTTKSDFNEMVLITSGLKIINFWAAWSDACIHVFTLMQAITALLNGGDKIIFIDWDRQVGLARELKVYGVPSLLIYNGGFEVARGSGIISEFELKNWIEKEKAMMKRRAI